MPTEPNSAVRAIYRTTITALPATTRAVFLEHRVDGDDLVVIARRHGLPLETVAQYLADALIAIDCALRGAGF